MGLFDLFRSNKPSTAQQAKDRLNLILMREHSGHNAPDFLPALQKELLEVISKYVNISPENLNVEVNHEGNLEMIEVKVDLGQND